MSKEPKKAKTLLDKFSRGYVRHWPSFPAKVQEAMLIAAGLEPRQIYTEGRGPENLAALVRAVRDGQLIAVHGGLRVFGDNHRQIAAAVAKIEQRGGIVIDVETEDRSDRHGVRMLSRALARMRGELTMGDRAAEIGAAGGKARGIAAQRGRMPEKQARKIWFDKKIDTATALSRMGPGWSKATARRKFGPSKRPMGAFKGKQE
jgi:hypothetical protein